MDRNGGLFYWVLKEACWFDQHASTKKLKFNLKNLVIVKSN